MLPVAPHFIYQADMPSIRYHMARRDVLHALTGFAVAAPDLSRAEQGSRQRLVVWLLAE